MNTFIALLKEKETASDFFLKKAFNKHSITVGN